MRIWQIVSQTPLFIRVVFVYVLIAAPISLAINHKSEPTLANINTAQTKVVKVEKKPAQVFVTAKPTKLTIPSLNISLDIIDGSYDSLTDQWTLSDYQVQYATMTPLLSQKSGTTMIYGHATNEVLGPTASLAEGDLAYIEGDNGKTFVYSYTASTDVNPTDTSILNSGDSSPKLALMTCSGLFNEVRRIMYFDLKEVK